MGQLIDASKLIKIGKITFDKTKIKMSDSSSKIIANDVIEIKKIRATGNFTNK